MAQENITLHNIFEVMGGILCSFKIWIYHKDIKDWHRISFEIIQERSRLPGNELSTQYVFYCSTPKRKSRIWYTPHSHYNV